MDGAPDVPTREQVERVARVDGERRILGLHPLPLASDGVPDLQRRDRLAEEEREGAEVGVPTAPQAETSVLLGGEFAVFHVAEVVLGFLVVGVDLEEVVLGELEGEGDEGGEGEGKGIGKGNGAEGIGQRERGGEGIGLN